MANCCHIFEKFEVKKNLVKEYNHWILLVRKNHVCLGSCVAVTKKHHLLLGELSPEEMAEYQIVAKEVENALKKSFNFDCIHHMVLMMKDRHTHFHIFPRYKESRDFAGINWKDDYNTAPLGRHNLVNQIVLDQIRDEVRGRI